MNISLKSLQQSTHKHQLLSEVFSDVNFYKYRSQSNTDQYTPIKGFQIVKLRGPSRQSQLPSQQSQKTIKSIKKRNNSQTSLKVDLFKHVIELDDNEMHDKLISLYEIDLNMCKNLQLNRMIVQDKQQQLYSEDITNEILLMLSNTIDRIHQYINANNLERSELKKAHRRTAIEIEHQMQEFVNMMLTAISKRNLPLAKLIESAWKLICIAIEMILQNSKAEQDYIKQQVLNELQQEVDQLKQENQEIYNKYMEVSELNYKLQQTHKQEINVLNYQLTMAKMEFNDYKQSQEALSNLENATGSLKDVEINLKDTNKILNKIEENISNRDTQLFQTLKSVVQQHKMDKESQMSKSQKLVYRYQLKSLTNKQCQIASEFFNHPFIPYLELINNQSFDEKQVQQLLIDWFNSECIKQQFGTHPAQQRLEQISTYERKSIPDGFLNYLLKNDNINQLQNCVIYISQNLEMSDMNLLTKVDKYNRQIGIFFGSILQFEINSIEIDLLTYDKIRFLYAGLQQQSQEENQPQNQNKFQWYNFVITNLADLCNSIFPEYQEKVVSQQQTVVQLLLLIMQGESDKRKQQHKKLLDEFKNADNDLNQQKERMIKFVKELSFHYNYQYNELQLIQYAQALFDRYVRVYQTGRRRAGLEIGEWIAYTQELFQVANKMIQLKPHLHHQISMIEDLLYINKEFQVNTRLLERKESMIKKK